MNSLMGTHLERYLMDEGAFEVDWYQEAVEIDEVEEAPMEWDMPEGTQFCPCHELLYKKHLNRIT